jgi:hypothetical protein
MASHSFNVPSYLPMLSSLLAVISFYFPFIIVSKLVTLDPAGSPVRLWYPHHGIPTCLALLASCSPRRLFRQTQLLGSLPVQLIVTLTPVQNDAALLGLARATGLFIPTSNRSKSAKRPYFTTFLCATMWMTRRGVITSTPARRSVLTSPTLPARRRWRMLLLKLSMSITRSVGGTRVLA